MSAILTETRCKICAQPSAFWASARVLGKYDVQYFRCASCGFVQTETPFWLEEAYSDAITKSDIGMVQRNAYAVKRTRAIVTTCFNADGAFVDYGGGYGLFVRAMRDAGFDFYRQDKYCENLFARGCDVENGPASGRYELLTAFEVFEHLVNPLEEVTQMLAFSRSILLTTSLIPPSNPKPGDWWYYGLDHGQHTALYTARSLSALGREFGLNFATNGRDLHLLTDRKISPRRFRLAAHHRIAALLNLARRRPSLLSDDYQRLTGRALT